MIAAKVEIKGMDDVLRTLNTGPKEMRAVARKSMTKAAKVTSKEMTHKTPERWRLLAGYRVSIGRRTGRIQARMGYYNSKKAKGKQPKGADHAFDWFKAYWGNYGTLDFSRPETRVQVSDQAKALCCGEKEAEMGQGPEGSALVRGRHQWLGEHLPGRISYRIRHQL